MDTKRPSDAKRNRYRTSVYSAASLPGGTFVSSMGAMPLQIGADWIINLLNSILQGLFGFVGDALTGGFKMFLLFESPYELSAPNESFAYNFELFGPLFGVVLLFGIASRPFADRERAASWRVTVRAVAVIVSIPLIRPVMDVILMVVNASIRYVFPSSYSLQFASGGLMDSLGAIGVSGLGLVVGGYLLGGASVLAILFVMAILMLREFLWYLVYHGWPILICMWYIDWGPLKVSNHIATLTIRTAAYLLLVGPLIALALQTGAMMAGNGAAGGAAATGAQMATPDTAPEFWKQFGFWFMGLGLASVFGTKAAMAGGMPITQIGRGSSSNAQAGVQGQASGDGTNSSLRGQAKEAIGRAGGFVDNRLDSAGGYFSGYSSEGRRQFVDGQKARIGDKAASFSDRLDQSKYGPSVKAAGAVGKFAAKEAYTGGRYAAKNLDESPLDWARSGAQHIRDNPYVQPSEGGGAASASGARGESTSGGGDPGTGGGGAGGSDGTGGSGGLSSPSDGSHENDWSVNTGAAGSVEGRGEDSSSPAESSASSTGSNGSGPSAVEGSRGVAGYSGGDSGKANDRDPAEREESDTGWEAKPRYVLRRTGGDDAGDRSDDSEGGIDDVSPAEFI